MSSLGTLWRTVRHLKLSQVTGRVIFRLRRPSPELDPAPPRRPWTGPWVLPAARRPSLLGPQRFIFLGVERELDQVGWIGHGAEKLWRYNQHYFDDLNAQGAGERRTWHAALLVLWLTENPPPHGDGWEPYPTSLRMVNWIKASASGLELPSVAWHSLAVQARWLSKRLERHLLGNHLFVNAKALVLAGLAFEGPEAKGWLARGLAILSEQLPEQVLPDGGQFERSPMYHALALEDLLDLINATQAAGLEEELGAATDWWREVAGRMLRWLRVMTHPDGKLARFNDGADGIAPSNSELERYSAALGVRADFPSPDYPIHLADSGYVRMAWGRAVALIDVALLGPDYLLGHAHADTLSFELSLHERPLVVNGGTSCYGRSARRLEERSTAAHSTLQLGELNSSEVWSGFRVGRRARPMGFHVSSTYTGVHQVSASHDGYCWLPGRPVHTRIWRFLPSGLEVEDQVKGSALAAIARYHLAPDLTLQKGTIGVWLIVREGKPVAQVLVAKGKGFDEPSFFAPEFGTVLSTWCLAVRCEDGCAITRWTWSEAANMGSSAQDVSFQASPSS